MTTCPECSTEVSENAPNCPKCGNPISGRQPKQDAPAGVGAVPLGEPCEPGSSRLSRHKAKVGTASFVAQVFLLVWTLGCFAMAMFMVLSYGMENSNADAIDFIGVLVCPIVNWLAMALPVGVAARVTMRKGEK